MFTLFIDLCSSPPIVAVATEDRVVAQRTWESPPREGRFFDGVRDLLGEAALRWRDITRIAVVTGPGGYTSLRLGVGVGNALAFILGVHIGGVPLSAVPSDLAGLLPPLLHQLSYRSPPLLPAYGGEPRVTPRRGRRGEGRTPPGARED